MARSPNVAEYDRGASASIRGRQRVRELGWLVPSAHRTGRTENASLIPGMLSLVALVFTASNPALLLGAMAQEESRAAVVKPSVPRGPTSPGKLTGRGQTVTFKDGLLSVKAGGRSLEWITEEISREAQVAIIRAAGVRAEPVFAEFKDLPVDVGLRLILKDYDVFFFYGAEKGAPASLRAVWVYPSGKGRSFAPIPPEMWASTNEVERMLSDPDPEVRSRAYDALIGRKGDKALDIVLKASNEQDDRVRTHALYQALSSGMQLPEDLLTKLALDDSFPTIRVMALGALAGSPNARDIAERALNDLDPHVQAKAGEILENLNADTGPSGPIPTLQVRPAPEPQ